jgi:hypothetical protein
VIENGKHNFTEDCDRWPESCAVSAKTGAGSIEAPAGFERGWERGVPVFELLLAPCSSKERTTSVCPPSIRSANSFDVRCAARSTRSWCSIA